MDLLPVVDRSRFPEDLWGGEWDGTTFRFDADGWADPPYELVIRMELALERRRKWAGDGEEGVPLS